jgi:signal transduction histidine kinase
LDAAAQDYLVSAISGTQRMQALVLALLEYFRADAKGILREPVDLGELVDEAVAGLRLQVEEAQGNVTRDALPRILADRIQLGRVLQNLLSNGLKFRSANPPHVHVAAKREGASWHVTVTDDGIGIAAKDLDRVLQPFQRTHSTDQYPGTGLGLSISKKIVELHGGRLWLASAPGQGTQVHFTLPADDPNRVAAPADAVAEPPEALVEAA